MVYKLVNLYGGMEDPDQFLEYHRETVIPKLLSFDGVIKICVTRLTQKFWDTDREMGLPEAQVQVELYVLDVEQFMKSLVQTKEGQEITQFLTSDAKHISNLYVGAEETVYKDLFFQS